jgi:hypothetical protein
VVGSPVFGDKASGKKPPREDPATRDLLANAFPRVVGPLICRICGDVGQDVQVRVRNIAGTGFRAFACCGTRQDCRERREMKGKEWPLIDASFPTQFAPEAIPLNPANQITTSEARRLTAVAAADQMEINYRTGRDEHGCPVETDFQPANWRQKMINGLCAEAAFFDAIGGEAAGYVWGAGDHRVPDIRSEQWGEIEVRTSIYGDYLMIQLNDDPDTPVVFAPGEDTVFFAAGWILAKDGKQPKWRHNRGQYWMGYKLDTTRYLVPRSALRPMDELEEWRESHDG